MSIQRYLLTIILSVIVLATFSAALQGFKASNKRLNQAFDEEMQTVAYALKNSPILASDNLVDTRSSFAFQIWQDNKLVIKSHNAPSDPISPVETGFGYKSFLADRWRFYSLVEGNLQVIVSQPVRQRTESVEEVLLEAVLPIVYVIPLIGLVVLFAIRKSLSPLKELSEKVRSKQASDLSAINLNRHSQEIEPIKETINGLLHRLEAAFEREQTLASNAAHELRTPISVLKLNTHNIKIAFEADGIEQNHIDQLVANTDRMAHVIEQVIALNRTNPENFDAKKTLFNIELMLQEVIANNYDAIESQQQSISLDASALNVYADRFSIETLVDNLVKNAIKYSGTHTEILISAEKILDKLVLVVEDSGIGIEEPQLSKITQRFYRTKQHSATGSGLGLSIVGQIVDLHSGKMTLERSVLGGLKVMVEIPQVGKEANDESKQD